MKAGSRALGMMLTIVMLFFVWIRFTRKARRGRESFVLDVYGGAHVYIQMGCDQMI